MQRSALFVFALWIALWPAAWAQEGECRAPQPVCQARGGVFAVSNPFDPLASAVLIAPGLLVTNRHVVADEDRVQLWRADGRTVDGEVVPTGFAGDLILIRAPGVAGEPLTPAADIVEPLYTVAADQPDGDVRVYPPGRVVAPPAADRPLARLHHSASSRPGNSGGALVGADGRLVAIVAAGGEGRNDAIPASRLAELTASSGPEFSAASADRGRAYRACITGLERGGDVAEALAAACEATGNRQLLDLLGQAFGRAGDLERSEAAFRRALALDPNSVNTLVGLAVTLHFAEAWRRETVVLRDLIERLPDDFQTLRMSVQAGKFAGDQALIDRALELIGQYQPDALDAAKEFLAN